MAHRQLPIKTPVFSAIGLFVGIETRLTTTSDARQKALYATRMAKIMTENFMPGETVKLLSGGPMMTVTECGTHRDSGVLTVLCVWFDGTERKQGNFPAAGVKRCDPSQVGNQHKSDWEPSFK
jgi:uncharacterized protein YodC (DUF2158 family)